jgi:predicted ester cyclase
VDTELYFNQTADVLGRLAPGRTQSSRDWHHAQQRFLEGDILDRRSFVVAASFGSISGTASAQPPTGRHPDPSDEAKPLQEDPSIHATVAVSDLLSRSGAEGDLARHWLRFLQGISGRKGLTVDDVVTPDVRCIDLQLAGLAGDISNLREFRASMNQGLANRVTVLSEMSVDPFQHLVEVTIHTSGKHVGEILGVPATQKQLSYTIRTLNFFKDDKMALRWDRTDLGAKVRQLA